MIRGADGEGRVLDGDGSSFHDATVRPATPDEVREHLEQTAPRRAQLEVGELLLAPGVPFSLDAGGFGRHTFLCGQSGSGKTYSLGVVLEQLLLETDLQTRRARSELRLSCGSGSCARTPTTPTRPATRRRPARWP